MKKIPNQNWDQMENILAELQGKEISNLFVYKRKIMTFVVLKLDLYHGLFQQLLDSKHRLNFTTEGSQYR